MMGAGLAAAVRAGLPTAALIHVLYQPFCELWGPLYVHTAAARAALGLPPLDVPDPIGAMTGVDLRLALVPPRFDYPSPSAAPSPCYIGPILEPAPTQAAADNTDDDKHGPLVLISFGTTTQTQHTVLPRMLEALADLPVRGLLTLGGLPSPHGLSAPSNVTVHDFLPHREVMHRVSAVVCHGGLSTIMASLAAGVPLVCLPQGREQGFNSERVDNCGAGLVLASDAAPTDITKAVDDVLTKPNYHQAATAVRRLIGPDAGGPAAVRKLQAMTAIR